MTQFLNDPTWQIYCNLPELGKYRGFTPECPEITQADMKTEIGHNGYKLVKAGRVCILLFPTSSPLLNGTDYVRTFRHIPAECEEIIMVVEDHAGKFKKISEELAKTGKIGHVIPYDYLIIVFPRVPSLPKFEICSAEEVQQILSIYRCSVECLPKIQYAVEKNLFWHGAKLGDVVKVTHSSEVTLESVAYKLVT